MRADVPGSPHWIEYRGPEELTIGDIDAYNEPLERLFEQDVAPGSDEPKVSDDGLTMTPASPRTVRITAAVLRERRDALLSELITRWSFDPPMPYTAASRKSLPICAQPVLARLADPHVKAINELDGPKEQTAPTGGSATTSPATSASAPPDSTPGPSGTAGGSSTTS